MRCWWKGTETQGHMPKRRESMSSSSRIEDRINFHHGTKVSIESSRGVSPRKSIGQITELNRLWHRKRRWAETEAGVHSLGTQPVVAPIAVHFRAIVRANRNLDSITEEYSHSCSFLAQDTCDIRSIHDERTMDSCKLLGIEFGSHA